MKLGIAFTAIILALTINTAEAKHGYHRGHHHRPFHGARSYGATHDGARERVRHASSEHSDRLMAGLIDIAGNLFHFVSGGDGWPIPIGDWEITPHDVGPWGARHGALGINHDEIPDARLHRTREGIEIHAANRFGTAGCIGILERFDRFKRLIFQMIDEYGTAWLHVIPGEIVITPTSRFALDDE